MWAEMSVGRLRGPIGLSMCPGTPRAASFSRSPPMRSTRWRPSGGGPARRATRERPSERASRRAYSREHQSSGRRALRLGGKCFVPRELRRAYLSASASSELSAKSGAAHPPEFVGSLRADAQRRRRRLPLVIASSSRGRAAEVVPRVAVSGAARRRSKAIVVDCRAIDLERPRYAGRPRRVRCARSAGRRAFS